MQRLAYTLYASSQDVEDATQEAMIVPFRKTGTLRAAGALSSWMFRIVLRKCLRRSLAMTRQTESVCEEATESAEDKVLAAPGVRAGGRGDRGVADPISDSC